MVFSKSHIPLGQGDIAKRYISAPPRLPPRLPYLPPAPNAKAAPGFRPTSVFCPGHENEAAYEGFLISTRRPQILCVVITLEHTTMEPVGLAVGVLGLAGLFSSCLEAIDKVQSYRSFTIDSQDLNSQFNAEKVRFEQWGQKVGFSQGQLSASHHHALDNPKISSAVKDLFLIIKRICESDDDPQRLPSKRRRLAWALRGKGERTEEVKMFGNIVQLLHHLAPPEGARGTVAVHELDPEGCDALVPLQGEGFRAYSIFAAAILTEILGPLLDHGTPFAELRQLIARWEGEMEGRSTERTASTMPSG